MAHLIHLDSALKRLSASLDLLEAAADRLGRVEADKRDVEDTLALMQEDRGRLANELDSALGRAQALERATNDVAMRLATAGTTLRRLLSPAGSEKL